MELLSRVDDDFPAFGGEKNRWDMIFGSLPGGYGYPENERLDTQNGRHLFEAGDMYIKNHKKNKKPLFLGYLYVKFLGITLCGFK